MLSKTIFVAAMAALASAHSVLIDAKGIAGSPSSVGFQVNPAVARNCTSISPCQQDTTIIRDIEIQNGVCKSCGRTQLNGSIDITTETANALAENKVTSVKAGTVLSVTIHQVNADGAGPYVCDVDESSDTGKTFKNVSVADNVPGANGLSQVRAQQFVMKLTMPDDLNCSGGSTGNICTVRCRNNALAGPFGGCLAVQQSDKKVNNAGGGGGNNGGGATQNNAGGNSKKNNKGGNKNRRGLGRFARFFNA
ncbi:hypothetical protein MCOR25_002398 [Pyricularia grisea]|uniref:GEgh 16 protein n=1 Tax=Pyricularia grisea TaxID=148305 RepID=A0A6P8AVS2_PYRGI|nr:uncharacterized protein PgNI_08561 [Pyricularia grisea]KAI6377882.1 hypothetical protein MCOR25_002398 [Pyricularia grisea]TLD06292.1 hypothetical protein PgNI_08561 [Pyricularia grisea]